MAKSHRIFIFFFTSLLLFITTSQSLILDSIRPVPIRNSHDYIHRFGLPEGILPSNVKSYDPNTIDLALEIKLERPCYAEIGGKLFHYDRLIRGYVNHGTMFELSGVKVKRFLSWWPVSGFNVDWDQRVVKVSYQSIYMEDVEELPLEKFKEIPMCKKASMDWLWMFHASDLITL